ncbi:MAG: hypothetical protein DWH82_02920 [Planctomycetota bacterium]|nr:MAG: hypothetical protein DWH82_02920 [Planctomycetota bacterium]
MRSPWALPCYYRQKPLATCQKRETAHPDALRVEHLFSATESVMRRWGATFLATLLIEGPDAAPARRAVMAGGFSIASQGIRVLARKKVLFRGPA